MLDRVFLGSNTDHVLHEGQTTMFVYKQPQKSMNEKRAVVPIDYSPVSNEVIRKADEWALDHDVELFFLYVQETPEMMNVSAVGGGYYSTSSDFKVDSGILRSRLKNSSSNFVSGSEKTMLNLQTKSVSILANLMSRSWNSVKDLWLQP